MALETRYKRKIDVRHNVLRWLVRYAAMVFNLRHVGEDGGMACERRKGRKFKVTLPELGEYV